MADASYSTVAADETKATDESNGPIEIDLDLDSSDADDLLTLLRSFVSGVLYGSGEDAGILRRIALSFKKHAPRLRDASATSARNLHNWTRKGTALRAIFVISIGTILLLSLTGLLVFTFFLLIATLNAIVVSLFMSMAAAGGFLAFFFACLTAIYVGALAVSIFVISITTISTVIAVIVATGWVGFFWIVWFAAKKSLDLTKKALGITTTAISAYSTARQVRHQNE